MWKSGVSGELRYFAGCVGIERAPAEGDDAVAQVGDREDDAVAETVVGDGDVVAADQHARRDHLLELNPALARCCFRAERSLGA